jgi:hypothetical protein
MKFFRDILKETDKATNENKFSQGRVYMLVSVVAYYLTIGVLLAAGMHATADIDLTKFKVVIDALEFAMVLFGGYVFGGKIVDVFKVLRPDTDTKK